MKLLRLLQRKFHNEVQCALCMGTVHKSKARPLYGRHICGWCERYYSTTFLNDWKKKARLNMLL